MPEDETVGFFSRFWDKIWQPTPRLLVLGAVVVVLFGAISSNQKNKIGEGITIILTLFIVCALDAHTAKRCEDGIREMIAKNTVQNIEVFRGGNLTSVKANDLVVGDVYLVKPSMMIPADSILIQSSERANSDIEFKSQAQTIDSNEPATLIVNELEVTGLKAYMPKQAIKNQNSPSTHSNVLFANVDQVKVRYKKEGACGAPVIR